MVIRLIILLILCGATFSVGRKEKENIGEIINIVRAERKVIEKTEIKLVGDTKIIREIDIES